MTMNGHDSKTAGMTDEQEAHLARIKARFLRDVDAKYRKGQAEHGGDLLEKPRLIDMALEEVLDLAVYLYTLKEVLEPEDPR